MSDVETIYKNATIFQSCKDKQTWDVDMVRKTSNILQRKIQEAAKSCKELDNILETLEKKKNVASTAREPKVESNACICNCRCEIDCKQVKHLFAIFYI